MCNQNTFSLTIICHGAIVKGVNSEVVLTVVVEIVGQEELVESWQVLPIPFEYMFHALIVLFRYFIPLASVIAH